MYIIIVVKSQTISIEFTAPSTVERYGRMNVNYGNVISAQKRSLKSVAEKSAQARSAS